MRNVKQGRLRVGGNDAIDSPIRYVVSLGDRVERKPARDILVSIKKHAAPDTEHDKSEINQLS